MKAPLKRIVADLDGGRVRLECGHVVKETASHHKRRRCYACAAIRRRSLNEYIRAKTNRAASGSNSPRKAFGVAVGSGAAVDSNEAVRTRYRAKA